MYLYRYRNQCVYTHIPTVEGRIMDSPNVSILMPHICDCVTSQGKRDFVDLITYPEMGNLSWIIWGAEWGVQYNHKGTWDNVGRQEGQRCYDRSRGRRERFEDTVLLAT